MFKHAGKCGAKIFDGTKVSAIEFQPVEGKDDPTDETINPGKPVSATWSRKDGTSGEIKFDYLVDGSGRAGVMSTKYLKNRSFNQDLKNTASWGYWKGAIQYGVGTPKEGQPYFEALDGISVPSPRFRVVLTNYQMVVAGPGSSPYTMALCPLESS